MKRNKLIAPYMRQFYRGNGLLFVLAMVQTVLLTGANLMISWLIQQIIDLSTGVDIGFTFPQIVGLTLISLLLMVGAFAFAYASKPRLIARGIGQYKEYVFARMCKKGISAFSGENSAVYISALSNDANSIETGYLANIFVIIDNTLMCAGALVLMFWYSPLLTVISVALSVLPLLASLATGNLVAKAEKQVSDRNETYMTTLKDSLAGFSVIKSFRAEVQMCRIFAGKVGEVSDAKCLRRRMSVLVQMLAALSGAIVQFGVFLIGAYMALRGAGLSAGTVLVFVQLLNFVISPVGTIPQAVAECKASRALVEKVAKALSENVREEGSVRKTALEQGITLENVRYGYSPEKQVLKGMNVKFEAGKSYALVGGSGCGKSTLLNLLMASDPNYTGSIRYDDTELRELNTEALYELVSVIQQNVFIFNASIRDNITMFSDFPREAVDRAMEQSGLSALVAARGEDFQCGENGNNLSGGEKQRISIARSLLKKSRVLLVDEATAALDARTASQVSGAILDLTGITRIVVTHSLEESQMRRYDRILTLKNGTVTEAGTFEELMELKGYFYSLFTVAQ